METAAPQTFVFSWLGTVFRHLFLLLLLACFVVTWSVEAVGLPLMLLLLFNLSVAAILPNFGGFRRWKILHLHLVRPIGFYFMVFGWSQLVVKIYPSPPKVALLSLQTSLLMPFVAIFLGALASLFAGAVLDLWGEENKREDAFLESLQKEHAALEYADIAQKSHHFDEFKTTLENVVLETSQGPLQTESYVFEESSSQEDASKEGSFLARVLIEEHHEPKDELEDDISLEQELSVVSVELVSEDTESEANTLKKKSDHLPTSENLPSFEVELSQQAPLEKKREETKYIENISISNKDFLEKKKGAMKELWLPQEQDGQTRPELAAPGSGELQLIFVSMNPEPQTFSADKAKQAPPEGKDEKVVLRPAMPEEGQGTTSMESHKKQLFSLLSSPINAHKSLAKDLMSSVDIHERSTSDLIQTLGKQEAKGDSSSRKETQGNRTVKDLQPLPEPRATKIEEKI